MRHAALCAGWLVALGPGPFPGGVASCVEPIRKSARGFAFRSLRLLFWSLCPFVCCLFLVLFLPHRSSTTVQFDPIVDFVFSLFHLYIQYVFFSPGWAGSAQWLGTKDRATELNQPEREKKKHFTTEVSNVTVAAFHHVHFMTCCDEWSCRYPFMSRLSQLSSSTSAQVWAQKQGHAVAWHWVPTRSLHYISSSTPSVMKWSSIRNLLLPVAPHKAAAEVSKIGGL